MDTRIRIGVSACLLGQHVRYDGGHKHDQYITGTLGRYFEFVAVCPEVECGMPTPRESMRLEGDPQNPRLITGKSRIDKTEQMLRYCAAKVVELEEQGLCGFIFKKNSPSSGLFRVKIYNKGIPAKSGSGLFAAAMQRHFPLLPMEEEGRLNDPAIRENFIELVFSYSRWKKFLSSQPAIGGLVEFHTRNKLLMMSHSPQLYRELGKLVAESREMTFDTVINMYEAMYMKCLALPATARKHTNVLQHILGYFKRDLTRDEKEEALELINQYHAGILPLIAPLILLKHFIRKYDQPYLKNQLYLSPHPAELMLRNHV